MDIYIYVYNILFLLLHIPVTLSSTSGVIFEKADINADCCETVYSESMRNSISSSVTGTQHGWPLVSEESNGLRCFGFGIANTRPLQGWLDIAANITIGATNWSWGSYKGLCIDGFLYTVVTGIIFSLK